MGNQIRFAISPEESAPKASPNQVYLMDKNLTEFPKQIMLLSESLEKLFVNKNHITQIPDTIHFDKFVKLTEVSLSHNQIKQLTPLFCQIPRLTILSMEHNHLTSIPIYIDGLVQLEELDLDFNRLDWLDLKSLSNLSRCNCSNNHLIHLAFESVEYLDASCNDLSVLDTNGENLTYVNCSHNLFAKWNYTFPSLHYLNLSDNLLEFVSEITCTEIYLNNNRISNFEINNSIDILEIQHNRLVKMVDEKINTSIEVLKLSYNEISKFSVPFKKLKILNLDHNKLEEFCLQDSTVETLDLSYNQISKFLPISCLKRLNVACNRLKCLTKEILELPHLTDLNVAMNEIDTIEVPKVSHISTLNLSFNRLTEIPDDIVHNLSDLITLDLSWNVLKTVPKMDKFMNTFLCGGNLLPEDTILPKAYEISEKPFIYGEFEERRSGVSEMIGKRSSLEDTHILSEDFAEKMRVFALFDGHNGDDASKLAQKMFLNLLKTACSTDVIQSIKDSLGALEAEICKVCRNDVGTTAAIVLIDDKKKIYSGNIGDTRSILVTSDGFVELSLDHRPTNHQEYNQIRRRGGFVKDDRVSGILAVSRTLGDQILKKSVSAEPFTRATDISSNAKYIVIACDGVWDVLSNLQVSELIQLETHNDCTYLAQKIRDCAYSLGSTDNISVIVIKL
jgi:protein phosphatase PTC1